MKYVTIPLLAVMIVIAGCAQNHMMQEQHDDLTHDLSDEDLMMIEHCKEMPEMEGCDHYLEHGEVMDGSDLEHMQGMPCHQMPDGSWMGDCDSTEANQEDSREMMVGQGGVFLPGETISRRPLPTAKSTSIIDVKKGDVVDLSADIVVKNIQGREIMMYGYNGQIPGPIFRGEQGSSFTVNFQNNIDWNTTVHWHGLRHDNKDDGVPGVTQDPTAPGQTHQYTVRFPDEGMYWYHPHIREDLQQDSGLAGNLWVIPNDPDYFNPVNYEEVLMLDDILLDQTGNVPYGKEHGTFSIMGRFGNVLLVNGDTSYDLKIDKGSVVRFYITNVANARPFNLSFGGAKIKLIGSDLGKYEREEWVDSVRIAPAERYIVEVYFENPGIYVMQNKNPQKTYTIGLVEVSDTNTEEDYSETFKGLRENTEIISDIDRFRKHFDKEIDYEIDLTIELEGMMGHMDHAAMGHGMMGEKLKDIEWEDDMGMMNARSNTETVTWIMKDKATGKENMNFKITAEKDSIVKLRFFNDPDSDHPMQHPMHLHGQRFLVLEQNGIKNDNMVWKDTVLLPTNSTTDILVDVTNPGKWMMHCHIAEHLEAGMMSGFMVTE